jgi:surface antigen
VPYARLASGVAIHGNAHTWWGQAAGKYERGREPRVGAVMSIPPHSRSRLGHVAVVSRILSDREVLLDHANWSRRGGIERGVRAVDVSDKGDWSRVKIWFASIRDLGKTTYPVNGFIYGSKASDAPVMMAASTPVSKPAKTESLAVLAAAGFSAEPRKPREELKLSDDVIKLAKLELKEARDSR